MGMGRGDGEGGRDGERGKKGGNWEKSLLICWGIPRFQHSPGNGHRDPKTNLHPSPANPKHSGGAQPWAPPAPGMTPQSSCCSWSWGWSSAGGKRELLPAPSPAISRSCSAPPERGARGSQANRDSSAAAQRPSAAPWHSLSRAERAQPSSELL